MIRKGVIVLIGTLILAAVIATQVPSWNRVGPSGPSHAQLQADTLMTQRMSNDVGGAMGLEMSTDGMLERSADDAYVRALEEHARLYARMTAAGA
jgi:hypothetical protein